MYELHVTVEPHKDFLQICNKLNVKPLVFKTPNNRLDFITSSIITSKNIDGELLYSFLREGLVPIRYKIEAMENVPAVYYECHFHTSNGSLNLLTNEYIATIRSYSREDLEKYGLPIEACILDSNPEYDDDWLKF